MIAHVRMRCLRPAIRLQKDTLLRIRFKNSSPFSKSMDDQQARKVITPPILGTLRIARPAPQASGYSSSNTVWYCTSTFLASEMGNDIIPAKMGAAGYTFNVNSTITPKFPPPPRIAYSTSSFASMIRPLASTKRAARI